MYPHKLRKNCFEIFYICYDHISCYFARSVCRLVTLHVSKIKNKKLKRVHAKFKKKPKKQKTKQIKKTKNKTLKNQHRFLESRDNNQEFD